MEKKKKINKEFGKKKKEKKKEIFFFWHPAVRWSTESKGRARGLLSPSKRGKYIYIIYKGKRGKVIMT